MVLLAAFGCNKNKESSMKDVSNDSVSINKSEIDVSAIPQNCYMQVQDKDSLFVQIEDNLGTITGKMYYKNSEKDSSFGDVVGYSDGDTLKVDYMFQSEGSSSTREIWFLKKDGKLIERIGSYNATGEQYADTKKIVFEGGSVLESANCSLIQKKLKKSPAISSEETAKPVDAAPKVAEKPKTETKAVAKKAEPKTNEKAKTKDAKSDKTKK